MEDLLSTESGRQKRAHVQGDQIGRNFRLLGEIFAYSAIFSPVGRNFRLLGEFFAYWANFSPIGRMFLLLGEFFDYWAIFSTIGRIFRLLGDFFAIGRWFSFCIFFDNYTHAARIFGPLFSR
jgi:hypothetical protein